MLCEAGLKRLEGSDAIPALAEWEGEAQAEEGLSAKERGSVRRSGSQGGRVVRGWRGLIG